MGRGVLVYWHGGAFINGIAKQHWQLIDHLTTATGWEVLVPRYGLAPAHDVGDVGAVLDAVVDGLSAETPLHVVGDSAGATWRCCRHNGCGGDAGRGRRPAARLPVAPHSRAQPARARIVQHIQETLGART